MKKLNLLTVTGFLALATVLQSSGQTFNSGSTGANGALNVTENTTIALPPDGVLHYTTITIGADATLTFTRNSLNTPAYLLAQGDVVVNGIIDVTGKAPVAPFQGGLAGPGGFDGGNGGFSTGNSVIPGGNGQGPGGGKHGADESPAGAGGGSYGTRSDQTRIWNSQKPGDVYGTLALIPLVGGSGGGGVDGNPNRGGGGGGGAVLISSNTKITINSTGKIVSRGGAALNSDVNNGDSINRNGGSGGAIRLVAPRVYGTGTLDVRGAQFFHLNGFTGAGRIRIDSIFKYEPTEPATFNMSFNFLPANVTAVGATMIVFPPNSPRLDLVQAAGTSIAEGTGSLVRVQLPFGTDTNQTVVVQARNFNAVVPIRVVLTPDSGDSISYDAQIDNAAANPATITVNAGFPINQLVKVHAWTR